MSGLIDLVRRNISTFRPQIAHKEPDALRIGLLGAANISYVAASRIYLDY